MKSLNKLYINCITVCFEASVESGKAYRKLKFR